MSLKQRADNGWLRPHQSSAREITDLLGIVERDLADAEGEISADWRFGIAYNAALNGKSRSGMGARAHWIFGGRGGR